MNNEKNEMENYHYRIYGRSDNTFFGCVFPENIEENSEENAINAVRHKLEERGQTPTYAVKTKNLSGFNYPSQEFVITFLYKDDIYNTTVVGDMPVIDILCSSNSDEKSRIGIGFGDIEAAENLAEKVLAAVRYLRTQKEEIKKEETKNASN